MIKKILQCVISIFLFFVVVEICLILINYGGDRDLVLEAPIGYENFLMINPNIGFSYSNDYEDLPESTVQLFSKVKVDSSYRIFVVGSSTIMGFPFAYNAAFPNFLKQGLQKTFLDKKIEVISVGISNCSTYLLKDLIDEIIEQNPDLLLIYTGDNEYYEAFGASALQIFGNSIWLANIYLKMNKLRIFLLFQDCFNEIKHFISFGVTNNFNPDSSLFSQIKEKQKITFNSESFRLGINQFKTNLSEILSKTKEANIPVLLGEIVSNIKDQKPFTNIEGEYSADEKYNNADILEKDSNYIEAKLCYNLARDYDTFRLRAPSEINKIINNLADEYGYSVVKNVQCFEENSLNRLIGNNLFIDYCHPNLEGNYLLAKAFYNRIINDGVIGVAKSEQFPIDLRDGTTELDSVYSFLAFHKLSSFCTNQLKESKNNFIKNFEPKNDIERVAYEIIRNKSYTINLGHLELGKIYEKENKLDLAYKEFNALINAEPHMINYYERAATILLKQKRFTKADSLLKISLKYRNSYFANKWIGQIALRDSNYGKAINYLSQADLNDSQVVFSLSRAYYETDQWGFGENYFKRLLQLKNAELQYISYLKKLRLNKK